MPDIRETEWQFEDLDVGAVGRWIEDDTPLTSLFATAGGTREISDVYPETDDWRIHRSGYAPRIRRTKGKKPEATMASVVSENGTSGLRSRRELSGPLDAVEPRSLESSSGPFVERLRNECGLSPAASKYEAGLFARGLTPPELPELRPTDLNEKLSTGELHDVRVAARRTRAAGKIFESAVPARTQRFRDEFAWVAEALVGKD
ncbi:MAG: CHAD domain-containing protein [Rubrobacteraceae bacterium]